MNLVNVNQKLAKKYYEDGNTCLYLSLVSYKNNTCIKAYTEDEEPIGDVEDSCISEYLSKQTAVMFINKTLNDETGLIEYTIKTLI